MGETVGGFALLRSAPAWEAEVAAGDYGSVGSWGSRAAGPLVLGRAGPRDPPGEGGMELLSCLSLPGFRAELTFRLAKGPRGCQMSEEVTAAARHRTRPSQVALP